MSPHFPYSGQIWLGAWERTRSQQLDGAAALDPITLSYLLEATGPVRLADGEQINASNVVPRTLVEAYERFEGDNEAREAYLLQVSSAVVEHLLSGAGDPRRLVAGLARAADERRLLGWSAHPDEQRELALTSLGGSLPRRPGPYLLVAINNAAGGKLDYYLDRAVEYRGTACRVSDRLRRTTVRVRLTNNVAPQADLPDYVMGLQPVRNTNVALVGVYGSRDANVVDVRVDGQRVEFRLGREQGHLAVIVPVTLPPKQPREVQVDLSEPASRLAPLVEVQPLVRDQHTVVRLPACQA